VELPRVLGRQLKRLAFPVTNRDAKSAESLRYIEE
jgi:hypothetical protein